MPLRALGADLLKGFRNQGLSHDLALGRKVRQEYEPILKSTEENWFLPFNLQQEILRSGLAICECVANQWTKQFICADNDQVEEVLEGLRGVSSEVRVMLSKANDSVEATDDRIARCITGLEHLRSSRDRMDNWQTPLGIVHYWRIWRLFKVSDSAFVKDPWWESVGFEERVAQISYIDSLTQTKITHFPPKAVEAFLSDMLLFCSNLHGQSLAGPIYRVRVTLKAMIQLRLDKTSSKRIFTMTSHELTRAVQILAQERLNLSLGWVREF